MTSKAKRIISEAERRGEKTLSEFESAEVLREYGVPVAGSALCRSAEEAAARAADLGFPVAMKACGAKLTHKTERGLVRLGVSGGEEAAGAYRELVEAAGGEAEGVLVQEMVKGEREFVIGLTRDPAFGPCVMFGLGGVFTEALEDVVFRVAPFDEKEAKRMTGEIRGKKLLGALRGMPEVDLDKLAGALVGLGRLGLELDDVAEVDVNPLVVRGASPVAVDALVVLEKD